MNNKKLKQKLYELKVIAIFTIPTIICLLCIGWILSTDTSDHGFDRGANNLIELLEHEHKMNMNKYKE